MMVVEDYVRLRRAVEKWQRADQQYRAPVVGGTVYEREAEKQIAETNFRDATEDLLSACKQFLL